MHSLTVDNLHKKYGDREVLKGVSLTANKGDVITLIGSSGSGKSTFLRCLNLLEQPHQGRLQLGDEELKLVPDRDGSLKAADAKQLQRWRARLAMVFQGFNLWAHRTVLENVIEAPVHVLGVPKAQALDKAEALLSRVGVSHRKDVYPAQLSGGEQQRVAIARALLHQPDWLFLDEATSSLDPASEQALYGLLVQRLPGTTILSIAHRPELERHHQRVLEIDPLTRSLCATSSPPAAA